MGQGTRDYILVNSRFRRDFDLGSSCDPRSRVFDHKATYYVAVTLYYYCLDVSYNMWRNELLGVGLRSPSAFLVPVMSGSFSLFQQHVLKRPKKNSDKVLISVWSMTQNISAPLQ